MSKLLILNAPKGAGKTELRDRIFDELSETFTLEDAACKERLYDLTMELFQLDPQSFWEIYNDRELKEKPNKAFVITRDAYKRLCATLKVDSIPHGTHERGVTISIRHAMIYVSECVAKPMFGENYFGLCRAERLYEAESTVFIDDSALGSLDEIYPAIDRLGAENIIIVRIYGRGDYAGDSRSYIDEKMLPKSITIVDVTNNSDLETFLNESMSKLWEVL